ncbi:MAG TPA: iron-siderophore ABC transporter substrate-binding protein [Pseudonocardiaceae bacterium]|nr:iron-siderophore ABC transporter substrate-binding protein [Pseudonocardiaceae bacterium]
MPPLVTIDDLHGALSRRRFLADATRRQFLIGGLSLAALLAACGSDDETPASSGSGDDRFPVTIDHRYGSTEIPAEPKRVVTVGLVEQDALLAFGVVPVATTQWFGEQPGAIFPWTREELGNAAVPEVLNESDGIQFERIAALRPDLILALHSGITQADHDRLRRIAPTVAQPTGYIDYGVPWQDLTRTVAVAVGRAEQGEQLIAEIGARFADVRADHPEFARATILASGPAEGENYGVNASEDPRSRIFTDLGFVVPAEIDELAGDQYYAEISIERVDLLDTDVLVWTLDSQGQRGEIQSNSLYAGLDVVTQSRDISLVNGTDVYDASNFVTVLSLPLLLDRLVPMLAAAVDGNPTTAVVPR